MIGIISDTHDNVPNIINAVEVFKKKRVSFVIHLGDIISPASVNFFKGLNMKFIKGNCDGDIDHLKKKCADIGAEFLGDFAMLEIKGKKLALYHGTDQNRLAELIGSGKYDYVLHGHTHKKRDNKINSTRVINPGAHYYKCENTIILLDLDKDKVEFVDVGA